MKNQKMMYANGGHPMEQAYQFLKQSGAIGEMSMEEFSQVPPEQIQQLVQQVQQQSQGQQQGPPQAQAGDYLDKVTPGQLDNSIDMPNYTPGQVEGPDLNPSARGKRLNNRAERVNFQNSEAGAAQRKETGKTVGSIASQSALTAAGAIGAGMANPDANPGGAGNMASSALTGAAEYGAIGSMFGPVGTAVGAVAGAGIGLGKASSEELAYNEKNQDAQSVDMGGLGGQSWARNGSYTNSQIRREADYAKSLAKQDYSKFRSSNKLGLNAKIYAAGQTVGKTKGGRKRAGAWMQDDTTIMAEGGMQQEPSMEAERGEVILGDANQMQVTDQGTGISGVNSAGGVLEGEDHGVQNGSGREGVGLNAKNSYIGSKRKTVDGQDIAVGKNGKVPGNSVSGQMQKILKEISKLENSNDRYQNNPMLIAQKKQELSRVRDLAEMGKFSKDLNKLIKKGDLESAKEMMQGMGGQEQAGQQNDMAMQGGMARNGGYYARGGYSRRIRGNDVTNYQRGGFGKNAQGYYDIDPSWPIEKQRAVNAKNYEIKMGGVTEGFKLKVPQNTTVTDNTNATAMAKWQASRNNGATGGSGTVQGNNMQNVGSQTESGTGGAYNPNGQPLLGASSVINTGAPLSDSSAAALQRPYGERQNGGYDMYQRGGYYAQTGDYTSTNRPLANFSKVQPINPDWSTEQQRWTAAGNRAFLGTPTPLKAPAPQVIDNTWKAQEARYKEAGMGKSPLPGGVYQGTPAALRGATPWMQQRGSGSGEPMTQTSLEGRAYGGYGYAQGGYPVHAQENRLTGRGGMQSPWRNGQQVSFYANGGYQQGTISNLQANGDFDLM